MFCENCGLELKKDTIYCSACGYKMKGSNETGKNKKKPVLIVVTLTFLLLCIVGISICHIRKTKSLDLEANKNVEQEKSSKKEMPTDMQPMEEEPEVLQQGYGTLLDYLNRPLCELGQDFGIDYILEPGLFGGGQKRLYYEDLRVKAMFGFQNSDPEVIPTGQELIECIYLYEGSINGVLQANMTIEEIENLGYKGEIFDDMILQNKVYKVSIDNLQLEFCYNWNGVEKSQYVICIEQP